MTTIEKLFRDLKAQGRKALMPFITAGDPDLDFSAALLAELVGRGCHLCEVGIPYSDPIADGPVIQESYTRALARHIKLADIFAMLSGTTPSLPAPIVTMVSYAIVYRHGPQRYAAEARSAGVAGLIVPDLPVEEAGPLAKICRSTDLDLIQLITPTTSRERALHIAETSTGFIYYVSVAGITGERKELPPDLIESVSWLKRQTDLPVAIGFGIGQPEHVRKLAPVADGLIVGSAIVRRIAAASKQPQAAVLEDVGQFVSTLLAALAPEQPSAPVKI